MDARQCIDGLMASHRPINDSMSCRTMRDYVHAVLGGLQAPDPNRPFQSRPQTPAPPSTSAPASRPAAAPVHGQTPYGSQPVKSQQAVTSGSGAAASKAIQGRAAPQSGGAKLQGNPQARVLVKLGLSKGQSGSNSRGGRSGTVALPQPPAAVSGDSFLLPCLKWKHASSAMYSVRSLKPGRCSEQAA